MLLKATILVACIVVCLANVREPKLFGSARPCFLDDYACIRRQLADKSRCDPRPRASPRQYRVAEQRFETPYFNASYIDHGLLITGQDRCYVSEFYFNLQSDTGVLGIDCPWLNFQSERTLLQHWPLKEDEVFRYRINGTYPMIRLTMSLANTDVLDICKAFTFAYIEEMPIFWVDPLNDPTDEFLSSDLSLLNIFERETFYWRGGTLARHFVNTQLCHFGCN